MRRALAFLPLLVPSLARAEVYGGTVEIMAYTIEAGGSPAGYVVATGNYQGGTWAAYTEYWFWDDAPVPDGGFSLEVYGTTPPSALDPDDAYIYANGTFPYNTTTYNPAPSTGRWFQVEVGKTQVGWLRVYGTCPTMEWYAFGDGSGHAPPRFGLPGQGSGYLHIVPPSGPPPGSLSNVSRVIDTGNCPG